MDDMAPAGPRRTHPLRILLLCSSFNGLCQRVWTELCAAGHRITVQLATDEPTLAAAVHAADPDLVLCPFLRERIPAAVWRARPTIVLHPGPKGDRGPSALDWAILGGEPAWGVTAVQAVEEMDAGPIWASRDFPVPADPPRKSAMYNGPVTDTAVHLIHEVLAKVVDPYFRPEPLDYARTDVRGRLRPQARQRDRAFAWSETTEHILRRIRAGDGSPGVTTALCGLSVKVYDAHRGTHDDVRQSPDAGPGTIVARRHGAALIRTGDGAIWIGHLRSRVDGSSWSVKLPATTALGDRLAGIPEAGDNAGYREIGYRRDGPVGVLTFRFYNGAMSTDQCRRLHAALRHATAQDTLVLLLRGGEVFSNGIHLGVIEAAADPCVEAWDNIQAIDDVCGQVIRCTDQLIVAALAGNAGAGGVMLGLGADRVVLRDGVVLNPHYQTMGLYGSEYWTYLLPRRVGDLEARAMTTRCLPISGREAIRAGLADLSLPGQPAQFDREMRRSTARLATGTGYHRQLAEKNATREAHEQHRPLHAYRSAELDQMCLDIFADRYGFAAARHRFLAPAKLPAATDSR
jgi:putative two-component system hydrogenase maturation factor HypX/HoxX